MFARLGAEEALLSPGVNHPSFGYATWPWAAADKSNNDQAKSFYAFWINFVTEKDFSWFDQWDLTEAPDRRVRRSVAFHSSVEFISHQSRVMEKENKKAREDARKDYNDTVRVTRRSFSFHLVHH